MILGLLLSQQNFKWEISTQNSYYSAFLGGKVYQKDKVTARNKMLTIQGGPERMQQL